MVGDDLHSDVLAAQTIGMTGVLTRTGKFRQEDLDGSQERPDHVVDSVADVPAALGLA
jgi:ribonucleotide monophosphatase NagD (HAD superfamily)